MKFLITLLLALASTSSFADTVTIDFQSLEHNDALATFVGSTYSEDGYTLDDVGFAGLFTFGTLESRYKGSTALLNNGAGSITRLTKSDAGSFTLNSIELADLNNDSGANVTFTGTKLDLSTVTQSFTVTGSLVSYSFTGFDNLAKVEWAQVAPFHQFDNIVLTSVAAVPEPETYAMLLAGLGLVGFVARRRKMRLIVLTK